MRTLSGSSVLRAQAQHFLLYCKVTVDSHQLYYALVHHRAKQALMKNKMGSKNVIATCDPLEIKALRAHPRWSRRVLRPWLQPCAVCAILGLAAGAGNAAAKHLARVACQDAKSRPRDAHDPVGFSD